VRRILNIAVVGLALVAAGCGDGPSTLTSPSFTVGGGSASNPGGAATIGYTQDAKVLLDGSCTRCHNANNRNGGVDLSSYAAVLRTVQPGNAASQLIRESRAGGSMFRYWRSNATASAEIIRRWIVEFQARENR
jgi:hypothetical protein